MYDELVTQCRDCVDCLCSDCKYEHLQKPGNFVPCMNALLGEAADAIEELLAERGENYAGSWKTAFEVERDEHRWIPATERLPEMRAWEDDGLPCSSNVLFRTDRTIHIGYVIEDSYEDEYAGNVKLYKWYMQGGFRIENVTHWMPLPEPPKEET